MRVPKSFRVIKKLVVLASTLTTIGVVYANPVFNQVTAGSATVTQTPNSTVIQQNSSKAIIEWHSFNIGPNESTHFQQPQGGVALNRIDPNQGASQIFGHLSATGKIILINQAGIFFGPSASVDVGGLIASTTDMSDANFLAGKYIFDKPSAFNGEIINEGRIIAANNGLIALAGNSVDNRGYIQANLGNVVLASGNKFTVSFDNDQMINFAIDEGTSNAHSRKAAITNTGSLIADGGRVLVTAQSARNVLDNAINMKGVAQATSVSMHNGQIILSGGTQGVVRVAGKLNASGTQGGNIQISGNHIHVARTATLDASGQLGGGQVLIGGDSHGTLIASTMANAQQTLVESGAQINADAIVSGNGGEVVVWSDDITKMYGNISARGGAQSGNGGFVETSGHYLDVAGARVDLRASNGAFGTWLLDPTDLIISNAVTSSDVTPSGSPTNSFTSTGSNNQDTSFLNVTDLTDALALSDVVVQTTSGGTGAGSGNITVSVPISWSAATQLTLTPVGTIYLNAPITASSGSVDFHGDAILSADVTTGGGQNYAGSSTLANNVMLTSSGGSGIAMSNTAGNGFGLTINNAVDSFFIGTLSGSGTSLTKMGAGGLILESPNTYTGATTIDGGTLEAFAQNAIANSNALVLANAPGVLFEAFPISGHNQTVGTLSGGGALGGNISLGANTLIVNQGSDQTYAGVISGSGPPSLIKLGSGVLTLSGSNTYTGTTQVSGGTLRLGASNVIPSGSQLFLSNLAGATLDLNGYSNAFSTLSGGGTTGGNISLGTGGALTVTENIARTYGGIISGAGSFTKAGSATLTLSAVNTYTGATTINAGTLSLGTANAIADSSSVALANTAGAALSLSTDNAINTLSGGGTSGGNIALGSHTLTVTQNSDQTYAGVISGATGNLVKAGNNTLALSGANTYGGSTTINAGTLQLDATNTLPVSSAVNIASGAALSFSNGVTNTLPSLTGASGSTVSFGSGSGVTTTGNQTYGLVSLSGDATLTSNTGNITIANGISGTSMNLALNGGNNTTFNIAGNLDLNNLTVAGGTGTNTLMYQTSANNPTWTITVLDAGNITGVSEMTGTFGFSNIQNLTGGSTQNNTFVLNEGGALSGTIDGGSTTKNNIINYSGYSTPLNTILTADGVGTIETTSSAQVVAFNQIQGVIGSNQSTLQAPNKTNIFTVSGVGQGSLNDPVAFNNFFTIVGTGSNNSAVFSSSPALTLQIIGTTGNILDGNGNILMQLQNIQNFSGNYLVYGASVAPIVIGNNDAIISNVVANSDLTSNPTQQQGTTVEEDVMKTSGFITNYVNYNVDNVIQNLQLQDIQILRGQQIYPNCVAR